MRTTKLLQTAIAILLSVILTAGTAPTLAAANTDVNELETPMVTPTSANDIKGHWAEETLKNWSDKGWFSGDGQGSYRPNENITRGEFMALINRMMDYRKTSQEIDQYMDLSKGHWYYDVISAALAAGYIKGTSDRTMSPEEPITRQEAMTIIARISGASDGDLSVLSAVSDGTQVAEWAKTKVAACISNGLVTGSNGRLFPASNITRAESVVLMDRIHNNVRTYTFAGVYGPESGRLAVSSVTIAAPGITLQNLDVAQNLTISADVGEGDVTLNNLSVKNNLYIQGGGVNSVYLNDVVVESGLIVRKENGQIRIVATGQSAAAITILESGAILITTETSSGGFKLVEIPKNFIEGQKIVLAGKYQSVKSFVDAIQISATGSIETLEAHANLTLTGGATVGSVTTLGDVVASVNGRNHTTSAPLRSGGSGGGGNHTDPTEEKGEIVKHKDETLEVIDDSDDALMGFTNLNPDYEDPPMAGVQPNYLLYGYNVLKYGYINSEYINLGYPIFDKTKVKEDENYIVTDDTKSVLKTLVSRSAKSLYEDFSASASVAYKGLFFSGSVKTEYGLKSEMSEESVLIKQIQDHRIKNQAYTVGASKLKELLSEDFLNDVAKYATGSGVNTDENYNENYNPEWILNTYGTHAITQYYLGGRAELNSLFTNKTSATEEEIKISAQATYNRFSGKATADEITKSKLVHDSSSNSFTSIGGNNITGTTPQSITDQYDAWVASIQDAPALCGIANIDQSLVPVWELIDDSKAAENVRNAFNAAAENTQTDLSQFDSLPKYITDIVVVSAKESKDAWAQIPTGYTSVRLNPGTNSNISVEANKGAGGNYIYIAYKLSTDRSKAITDIYIASGDNSKVTSGSDYTKIPVDLNEKAGGKFIYLCYKKITDTELKSPDTLCLKEIRGIYTENYTVPAGWAWPHNNSNKKDLNEGAGGEFIYLLVRKGV